MIVRRTILKVNNSEYDVLRLNYKFQRDIDAKGRPCSNYYGGEISVMLESTDNIQLFQQMIHKDMPTVDGFIEVLSSDDEVCIRRIEFKEAYICSYAEQMQSGNGHPMLAAVSISPMRLDFNNLLKIDRRWPDYNGWGRVKEEVKYVQPKSQAPPTPLVTAVKGERAALPNTEVEYSVTDYSINVSQSNKDRVKWAVEVDDKQEVQKQQGEKIKLSIKEEWIDKEITVMPYLKEPTEKISVKTKVDKFKKTVFFARSRSWAGKTTEGKTKEDMMYNDKTVEEILAINKLFKIQLNNTGEQLFTDMALLFSAGTLLGGSENAKALLAHFKSNKGSVFSSSYMNEQLKRHETLNRFVFCKEEGSKGVLKLLCEQLQTYKGNINSVTLLIGKIESTRVKFNTLKDNLQGMTLAVDDTSAYQVYVDDYKLNSSSTFSCKLRIEIYDHFGLDKADVEKYGIAAGFRAWYVLQHQRGYRPFLTKMMCTIEIDNHSF